jgi:hypothetical protein
MPLHMDETRGILCYIHLNEVWRTLIKCQEARAVDEDLNPQPPAREVGLLIIEMRFPEETLQG